MMKYHWKSENLRQKYNAYSWLAVAMMAMVLLLLYFLPEDFKMVNMVFIIGAGTFWYLSYRMKSQDRKLK